MPGEAEIEAGRRLVRGAGRVVALTGAGISAESGVPTFRGADGLWKTYRPEDLATPEAFRRNPALVWEWYDWRRQRIAAARPNPGHEALARLEKTKPRFTLVTQNVDGLHQLAGSRNLHELHGCLWTLRCVDCGEEREDRTVPLPAIPPRCACGGLLRPGVVWFGEPLPVETLQASLEEARACDLLLVVGTSAVVYPAAGVANAAVEAGHPVIEINPDETPFTPHATISLRGRAGEILRRICPP